MSDLSAQLLRAHEAGDAAALVALYISAAEATNDVDAAGFYLTHAYVFALEANHPDASALRQRLIAQGRETPLAPAPPRLR
jgi:hypothetical protein